MNSEVSEVHRSTRLQACAEVALIFMLFFVLASTMPPDVNEAHYVTKAKHYWNPSWCQHDHFLNSADAHQVFYWTFGWLTLFFSLPTVTWIGRLLTWSLLAWSWRRLSVALVPAKLYSVLTAALFATLIRWGHMAGEWVIGGVEAKGFAYVLILLALESLVRRRWRLACLLLGGASAFHVVAGGWALVAAAWTWLSTRHEERPPLGRLLPALIVAGLLALFGLVPGLRLSWSADPETVRQANHIYVFERLSHHLVFHDLPHAYIARHVALLLIWAGIWYQWPRFSGPWPAPFQRFHRFVAGAVAIAVAGVVLDQSLLYFRTIAASLLRYYWFRLSDVMVPMGVTFGAAACLQQLSLHRSPSFAWSLAITLLVATGNVSHVAFEHFKDPRPGAISQAMRDELVGRKEQMRRFHAWRDVCSWIRENTRPDDVFLTPRHQQTFHWYAERAEVVCAKNIPQDAVAIVQWRRRFVDVFPWSVQQGDLAAHGEQRLLELARKYKFQYIVVDRAVSQRRLNLQRVYPAKINASTWYEVYLSNVERK